MYLKLSLESAHTVERLNIATTFSRKFDGAAHEQTMENGGCQDKGSRVVLGRLRHSKPPPEIIKVKKKIMLRY